jgi:hypothetical protein
MDGECPSAVFSEKSVLCGESIRSATVTLDHLDAALASLLSTCNTARVEAEGYFASLGDDSRLIVALLTRLQDPSQVRLVRQAKDHDLSTGATCARRVW